MFSEITQANSILRHRDIMKFDAVEDAMLYLLELQSTGVKCFHAALLPEAAALYKTHHKPVLRGEA